MSLPKTLEIADRRLEEAEKRLENHFQEVMEALKGNRDYQGLHQEEVASKAAVASTYAFNAKKQFSRYKQDFEKAVNGDEKIPAEVMKEHDIAANTEQYRKAYQTVEQIALRHERLHRQIKGLSQVMEQNGMGNLYEHIEENNPWYMEPKTARYSKKA